MAQNQTDIQWSILQSPDLEKLILAFCLSMVIGLMIGALIYILLTWMSRRRASARITRRPTRQSRSSTHSFLYSRPAFTRSSGGYDRRSNNSLASAALSFYRQASVEQADPLGRKPSFRASTFHPLLQCNQAGTEAQDGAQSTAPCTPTTASSSTPTRPDSFWSNSSTRGLHITQTPPPAYNSVIRAFQETCT